jgi:hypothetical protein
VRLNQKKIRAPSFILPLLLLGAADHTAILLAQSAGAFTPTGNMTAARFSHTATLLPDGRVLIAGGNTACHIGGPYCLRPDHAELYDPATGTFTATGSMSTAFPEGAVLLPDGKVLIAGVDITETMASVEFYDPSTGEFNTAGKPATLTAVYSTSLLNDGRVLLIGRAGTSPPLVYGAELYDPVLGTFSPVANWPQQDTWVPAVLASGKVLLATDESRSGCEIYDPATGTFTLTGALGYFDGVPHRTLLLNGAVLFTGGNTDFGNANLAELYDPAAGIFARNGSMFTARNAHSATLLPDGTVLVAGGAGQSGSIQPPLASAEIYDPATSGFSTTGSLASARYAHTATLLNNGQVLITGGMAFIGGGSQPLPVGTPINGISNAELYTPALLVPAPALFSTSSDRKGQGAIWHAQTGQIATADNPATAGEALSMYTTNLADGSVITPQVIVGGRLAQVLYFGSSGYPGYNQVNFRVPSGDAPGPAAGVRLTYLGRPSNEVTLAVQ